MTCDDYQREYEAMVAWAEPHHHRYLFDPMAAVFICKCGDRKCVKKVQSLPRHSYGNRLSDWIGE